MYIDLIVLIVLFIIVILSFNKFHSYILFFGIVDITLRILAFLKHNIPNKGIADFISKYLPESIMDIINKYTSNLGIVNTILQWVYIGIMIIFLYYVFKVFIKKKKI